MSAPTHLHDELLSDTHDSLSTAVNSHDDPYLDDKYAVLQCAEYSLPRDRRSPLYSIPEWEQDRVLTVLEPISDEQRKGWYLTDVP
uniref:Uncharacterized protein n=1 Tax=Psilocybe cubensis TaxID=181762 RepID=A0A8H8CN63_PSICU